MFGRFLLALSLGVCAFGWVAHCPERSSKVESASTEQRAVAVKSLTQRITRLLDGDGRMPGHHRAAIPIVLLLLPIGLLLSLVINLALSVKRPSYLAVTVPYLLLAGVSMRWFLNAIVWF